MLCSKEREETARFFGKRIEQEPSASGQRRALRERILKAIAIGHSAPRELYDALADEETDEVDRELRALVQIGALRWNGQRGPASRYYRT